MKALSIVEPGGARIASGEKTLEIRRWAPNLGPEDDLVIVENGRFLRTDGDEDHEGRIVAIVRVAAGRPFVKADLKAACGGYFEEGWLAWELQKVRPAHSARKVKAARGIYYLDLPDDASIS